MVVQFSDEAVEESALFEFIEFARLYQRLLPQLEEDNVTSYMVQFVTEHIICETNFEVRFKNEVRVEMQWSGQNVSSHVDLATWR